MSETFNERRLRADGFAYMDERELWFHRDRRKAFSYEAARDYNPAHLQQCLAETIPSGEFWFYRMKAPPSEAIHIEILRLLNLAGR